MTTAQEILNQRDPLAAIKQKHQEKMLQAKETGKALSATLHRITDPLPKAHNRVETFSRIASNCYTAWQGVRLGMNMVRGFKSAFKK